MNIFQKIGNQSNEAMINANCIQHATVDHLDYVKFMDSYTSTVRSTTTNTMNLTATQIITFQLTPYS